MSEVTERNQTLDILKFIFALLIVYYHAIYVINPDSLGIYPKGGYIGVEFFFVSSGFLMARSFFYTRTTAPGGGDSW